LNRSEATRKIVGSSNVAAIFSKQTILKAKNTKIFLAKGAGAVLYWLQYQGGAQKAAPRMPCCG
jgi:hypothetical protein